MCRNGSYNALATHGTGTDILALFGSLTGAILISVIILKCRNKRNAKNEKIISMAMCGGINLSQCIPVAE